MQEHNIKSLKDSNTDPHKKNSGWIQVLSKGKKFMFPIIYRKYSSSRQHPHFQLQQIANTT